ncbi:MAG: hypothetical protein ABEJ05_12605 [Haloglomus sp.]
MSRGWICDNCERIHADSPSVCRGCGNSVLRPVGAGDRGDADARRHSDTGMTGARRTDSGHGTSRNGRRLSSVPDADWRSRAKVALALLALGLAAAALIVTAPSGPPTPPVHPAPP